MKYIKSQIQEINSYRSLPWYGAFLSVIHVVTFFFWQDNALIYQYLTKTANSLCWPQIPFCESFRILSPLGVQILLFTYLAMAILTVFLFLNRKTTVYAYWLFLALNLLKLCIFLMDYRLLDSYHYLPFFVSFAYLFIRQKLFFIPLLISCFYIFTAFLKVNHPDWLMSLVFSRNVWFPSFVNENLRLIICFYIIFLEMFGSLFLILKSHWKAFVYIQFMLFYALSYFVVSYFYPTVLLSLFSLFFLSLLFNEKYVLPDFKKMLPGLAFVCVVLFGSLLSFFIPGPAALTGEGRLYGLNMPNLRSYCSSHIILRFQNGTLQEYFPKYREYPVSLRCDPYIEFNAVKKICALYKKELEFIDLDWSFHSQLRYDLKYKQLIDEKNVCSKNLKYFSWKKNDWIKVH